MSFRDTFAYMAPKLLKEQHYSRKVAFFNKSVIIKPTSFLDCYASLRRNSFCRELFQRRFFRLTCGVTGVLTWELLSRTKPYRGFQRIEIFNGVSSGLAFSTFEHCNWLHEGLNWV